jgi:hypothetical protein
MAESELEKKNSSPSLQIEANFTDDEQKEANLR